MNTVKYKTAESVRQGHPDKVADSISDAVLDYALRVDSESRVACETLVSSGLVVVTGEVSSSGAIPYESIAKAVLSGVGYDPEEFTYVTSMTTQSPDISQGVDVAYDSKDQSDPDQGAGDQGTMYGYATNETEAYLPLPLVLAHDLCRVMDTDTELQRQAGLLPDGKAQVTVEYSSEGDPLRVSSVVVSAQHNSDLSVLRSVLHDKLVKVVLGTYIDDDTQVLINPAGVFHVGGPVADAGLTGRKLMVDTYGGLAKHGGGAFSGKDPSKVDRSAAYLARCIAKNLVAHGYSSQCEVGLSYAIGVASPVGLSIDLFGEGSVDDAREFILDNFGLTPEEIIQNFKLKSVEYLPTSRYGHFSDPEYPWEHLVK